MLHNTIEFVKNKGGNIAANKATATTAATTGTVLWEICAREWQECQKKYEHTQKQIAIQNFHFLTTICNTPSRKARNSPAHYTV